MGRIFDNVLGNYMKRASVNFGLNGATELSVAFWFMIFGPTGTTQRLCAKEIGATGNPSWRSNFDPGVLAFSLGNTGSTQLPNWDVEPPGYNAPTRYMYTWKANAFTSADAIVYLNGVSQTIKTFTASGYTAGFTLGEDSNNFYMGIRQNTLINPVNGIMGWFNIWNRQLTPAEVASDALDPRAVTRGLLSRVELCPDTDDIFGGSMTVNGTLSCAVIPTPSSNLWAGGML